MINITQRVLEAEYELNDCRTLNRMEMIGFISCDIMNDVNKPEKLMNYFRKIYLGITRGPWTIECNPQTKSIILKCGEDERYHIVFVPVRTGMDILYFDNNMKMFESCWTIEEVEDNLV